MPDTEPNSQQQNENSDNEAKIKFRIKTLKSDLEETSGEELLLNFEKQPIETKEIKLSQEKQQEPINQEKKQEYSRIIEQPLIKQQDPFANQEYIFKQKSAARQEPIIKKEPEPIIQQRQIENIPIAKKEKEQIKIKFSEQKKQNYFAIITNPFVLTLIAIIIISLIGFFAYKKFEQKKSDLNIILNQPKQQAQNSESSPIFVPPTNEKIKIIDNNAESEDEKIENENKKIEDKSKNIKTGEELEKIEESKIATTEEPKSPREFEPIPGTQKEIQPIKSPQETNFWALDLPAINVSVDGINNDKFKKSWSNSLKNQKQAGALYVVNFASDNKKLPANFIIDYFINPTFIEEKFTKNFKKSFGSSYEIVYYFTHTRKFPMFIFEIKDDLTAIPFLKLWDKETMISDLKNIYYELSSGKFTRNYLTTQNFIGVDYRIAFKNDDYKLIWSVYNNKLIISSSVSGFQILIDKIKTLE